MGRYLLRRLVWVIVVLLAITLFMFVFYFVMPGHDIAYWRWNHGVYTAHAERLTKHHFGLDRPVWMQYGLYLRRLVLGDRYGWPGFGVSFATRTPLHPILASRLLVSLQVVGGAMVLWVTVAGVLGTLGALRPGSRVDRLSLALTVVGVSVPVFLLGELALYVLWYRLHLVPPAGFAPLGHGFAPWFGRLLLPWVVLSLWFAALYTRMWRLVMAETLSQDHIRAARAFGLSERRVVLRHGVRASVAPIVTMFGMDAARLIGSDIIVEKVFNIPGLGYYVVQSAAAGDLSALAAVSLVVAVLVTVANLAVDVVHAYLDPRVRYA